MRFIKYEEVKFKNYEQVQKKKFSSKQSPGWLDFIDNKISIDDDWNIDEYSQKFRELVLDFHKNVYDYLIKSIWMSGKFCYDGKPMNMYNTTSVCHNRTFSWFMRNMVGFETGYNSYSPVITYFDDFHPDLMASNPFENKFEFPYKNITLDYLLVVYRMPVRLDILKYAEDTNMKYAAFLDYVWNWCTAFNDEHGKSIYIFTGSAGANGLYLVKVGDKKYGRH